MLIVLLHFIARRLALELGSRLSAVQIVADATYHVDSLNTQVQVLHLFTTLANLFCTSCCLHDIVWCQRAVARADAELLHAQISDPLAALHFEQQLAQQLAQQPTLAAQPQASPAPPDQVRLACMSKSVHTHSLLIRLAWI